MLRVVTSVFGRIRERRVPALLPGTRIKLINVLISHRFDRNNPVLLSLV